MLRLTTLIVLVSGLCALATPGCGPQPGPNPTLDAPGSSSGGSTLVITGQRWGTQQSGCSAVVKATAYVAGISPFALVVLPDVSPDANGDIELSWSTPAVFQDDLWTVDATQTCSGRTEIKRTVNVELKSA